jgi:hypothetical protein
VLVWFAGSQNLLQVERLLSAPPPEIGNDIQAGNAARRVLGYHAREVNRRVLETWGVLELGIAAALLATTSLTAHRSRTTVAAAALLTVTAAAGAFYLTPSMNAMARSLEFVPDGPALSESEDLALLVSWHRMLDILQLLLALTISVRLLFDFYEFRRKFTRDSDPGGKGPRRSSRTTKGPAAAGTAST